MEVQPAEEFEHPLEAANAEAEAGAPQRSLFSWSEFMAEPAAKPKSRARNAQPSLSLFEWAVAVEQSQEEERLAVTA